MRYYVAYKHQGADIRNLISNLNIISNAIEKTGNRTYVFFRDGQKRGEIIIPLVKIMPMAFEEINKSDGIFLYIDNKEKSEGLLIEAGYAKAMNKKLILAIKKGIDFRFLRNLADEIIEFNDMGDLEGKIEKLA